MRYPTREIIKDAGIFCDCSKIEEYAMALEKAIHTDFGDKPRRRAEEFSWDKVAQRYDAVFQQVISESKARYV